MAIGVVMDFIGATSGQYHQVIDKTPFTPGPGAPEGMVHWCTTIDGGVRVTELRDTREQLDAFATEQIGPITAKLGFPKPPVLTFCEVHSHLTAGGF